MRRCHSAPARPRAHARLPGIAGRPSGGAARSQEPATGEWLPKLLCTGRIICASVSRCHRKPFIPPRQHIARN